MLREPLEVGLAPITIADVVDVSRGGRKITVSGELEGRVRDSRDFVERWIRDGKVAYGVNTGFGSLATVRISHGEIEHLQVNLLRSHAAGVGEPLSEELVRAMLFLRAVALLQGCSGIRFSVIVRLLDMLERRIHPVVPCQGSVGASGDLAPLAHLALALIGEGEVFHQGCRVPSAEALRAEGLEPLTLEAKEGLALINGTQAMAAHGCLALADLGVALRSADVTACMSLEALMGT
ncbi:MAG: aromatic amino acid lyase, partial [Armatimonadetes bacterium]|nr:aromatic amino acid lyase [Armatimonadota bacterium]